MRFTVRLATERDIPEVAELCVKLAEYEGRIIGRPIDADEILDRVSHEITHARAKGCAYFVAESGAGKVVSVLKVSDVGRGVFRLSEAFTEPRWRKHGIMTSLFSAALAWAASRGARTLYLTIVKGNNEALSFWKSLGFTFDRFVNGHLIRMKRPAEKIIAV